jgi:hypothetical protein
VGSINNDRMVILTVDVGTRICAWPFLVILWTHFFCLGLLHEGVPDSLYEITFF